MIIELYPKDALNLIQKMQANDMAFDIMPNGTLYATKGAGDCHFTIFLREDGTWSASASVTKPGGI